ncbi:MAG: VOC family protein [Rhodospirillaceae bacterium]|jgi:catechol 2,3-dioxygenase-like lactoylglutathione lyase family enzyme
MDTINPLDYIPDEPHPFRTDPPGTVKEMPSPREIHHVHIFSDTNYEAMVEFYTWLFNAEIIRVNPNGLTFISYDDHDHRVVIVKRKGWGTKPGRPIGVSHLAFAYASLGELVFIYKKMKEKGYKPVWTNNHGNSTSFYYKDPDGNMVETQMDNYTTLETQQYKRYYQWSDDFLENTGDGDFDPDKMVELYESGVSDKILCSRHEVARLVKEGKL